jgi:long-subunit acyl-CoA synthetase (AMP-forming)
MTELGGPALISHIGNDIIESVGRPLPGIVVKIQKFDSKQLCGPRQTGHLLITGTNIHANIYRNSKATSDLMTSDGYVKTGKQVF